MIALVLPALLFAQSDRPRTFTLKKYDVADGLLHRQVHAITQDRDGFLWLATAAGVQRFDGYTFTSYTKAEGLHGDVPAGLVQDSDGLIWILYAASELRQLAGIDILDPRSGRIETFAEHFRDRAPLPAKTFMIWGQVMADSTLLLAATDHLVSYHGRRGFNVVKLDATTRFLPLSRGADGSTLGIELSDVDRDHALFRRSSTGVVIDTLLGHELDYVNSLGTGGGSDVQRAQAARADGCYFMTWTKDERAGQCWLSPTGDLRFFPSHPTEDLNQVRYRLRIMDDLWLVGSSIRRLNAGDDPLIAPVVYDLAERYPEISIRIRSALIDRAGHVWIGSEFGLYQLDIRPSHFQRMLWQASIPKGFGKSIRGMAIVGDRLHVNTESMGYWILDPGSGAAYSCDSTPGERSGLTPDGEGGLWRGFRESVMHERSDGSSVVLCQVPAQVRSFLSLGGTGLLIGTSNGLYRWDRSSGKVVETSSGRSAVSEALHTSTIFQLTRVGEQLWACATTGLFRLNDMGVPLERWSNEGYSAHYLPAFDFRQLYVDAQGVFWLASGGGILRWEPTTGTVRSVTRRDGMSSLSVHALYPDKTGQLWAPTDDGLVRYDPGTGRVRVFTTADGIAHNEFNRLAHTRGPDGRLYFGGLNGITAFDPDRVFDVNDAGTEAPLLLTGMYQFDAKAGRIVDRSTDVRNGEAITVRPGESFFNLRFALLSFEPPKNILYAWRIDGINADWNYQHEPDLRFTTLPYGDHVLRIKAQGSSGVWNTKELVVPIDIVRPIYLQGWFIIVCALALAGLIYAVFRYRLGEARKVFAMRDRIAADLHDEVGSSLSNIAMFGELMRDRAGDQPPQMRRMIDRIASNSAKALENMNDIVWNVNTRFEGTDHLVARMRAFAVQAAEARGFRLVFEADDALKDLKLNMEQRKNVYLIFKEAVNNAAKYSDCNTMRCGLTTDHHRLHLTIADDGRGFEEGARDGRGGGNGLANMKRRAEVLNGALDVRTASGQGTTVSLTIATGHTSRTLGMRKSDEHSSFASSISPPTPNI